MNHQPIHEGGCACGAVRLRRGAPAGECRAAGSEPLPLHDVQANPRCAFRRLRGLRARRGRILRRNPRVAKLAHGAKASLRDVRLAHLPRVRRGARSGNSDRPLRRSRSLSAYLRDLDENGRAVARRTGPAAIPRKRARRIARLSTPRSPSRRPPSDRAGSRTTTAHRPVATGAC